MERVTKVGLVALALVALVACSKNTQNTTENASAAPGAAASASAAPGAMASASTAPGAAASAAASPSAAASVAANGVAASDGAKIYQTNCSSCHQATGAGVPNTFPPLAGNTTVTGDPKKVIHIVKYGLNGKITVNGQTFNGTMPQWSQQLSDADIAAVVTYIRSSWGNKAGAVTEADVKAVAQ